MILFLGDKMITREVTSDEIFADTYISGLENSLQLANAQYEELGASRKKFLCLMAICSTVGISGGLSIGGEDVVFSVLLLGCFSGLFLPLCFMGFAQSPVFFHFSSRSSDVGHDIGFSLIGVILSVLFCYIYGGIALDKKWVEYRELKDRKMFLETKLDTYKKLTNNTTSC